MQFFCHFLQLVFYLESWNLTALRVLIDCYYLTKWSRIPNKLLLHHFKSRQAALPFAFLPFTLKILGGVSVAIAVPTLAQEFKEFLNTLEDMRDFQFGDVEQCNVKRELIHTVSISFDSSLHCFCFVCMVYATRLLKLILKGNFSSYVRFKNNKHM